MIFGYAEGIDKTIDLSKFIYNKDLGPNINFFDFLLKNFTLENNIFLYMPLKAIRFTYIPDEIKIYIHYLEYDFDEGEENQFLIKVPYIVFNSEEKEFCNYDYKYDYELIIKQTNKLIKNSQYFYIDYQYLVTEITEEDYFSNIPNCSDFSNITNNINSQRKIYFGRTNRLKFKLCHDYCETCYELGTSIVEQKCISCLPEYQYDYLYFSNRVKENQNNCVPEGYYYDTNENKLYKCDSTEKFFILLLQIIKKYVLKKKIIIIFAHFQIHLIKK